MQSPVDLYERKDHGILMEPVLGDLKKGIFSIELWKNTFFDAFSLLCPMRAKGHECGCLPVLARMVRTNVCARFLLPFCHFSIYDFSFYLISFYSSNKTTIV